MFIWMSNKGDPATHLLECKVLADCLSDKSILAEVEYNDLFGNINEQKQITHVFKQLLEIKINFEK